MNDGDQSHLTSRLLVLPLGVVGLLLKYLTVKDSVFLLESDEELKEKCDKIQLLEKRAAEIVKKRAPLYSGNISFIEHALLIERGFKTAYSLPFGKIQFGSNLDKDCYRFELHGLPPPTGTVIHLLFNDLDFDGDLGHISYGFGGYTSEEDIYQQLESTILGHMNHLPLGHNQLISFIDCASYSMGMMGFGLTVDNIEPIATYCRDEMKKLVEKGEYGRTNARGSSEFVYRKAALP